MGDTAVPAHRAEGPETDGADQQAEALGSHVPARREGEREPQPDPAEPGVNTAEQAGMGAVNF